MGYGILGGIEPQNQSATQFVSPTPATPDLNAFLLEGPQLFGIGMQAYGNYVQAELEAETLEYNATIAEREAEQLEKVKKHEIHKEKTKQRRLLAKQISAAAASGRQMSGSPLDVMARSQRESETDQAIIRSNIAAKKGQLYSRALYEKSEASVTKNVGRYKSFQHLLTSGTKTYAKSNYFKNRNR